jgi:type VI secretion system secreted protein Hcp
MAVDAFLKIDGVKGESADSAHKDEIDVLSWTWGATQTGTTQMGTGSGAGKANVQDLTVMKYLDKSTPILLKFCMQGTVIKEALLTVRKAGGKPLEYVKIKLTNVIVSAIHTGGAGSDERLTENLGLNFGQVKFEYVPQKADGSGDAAVPMGWDIAGNEEL